MKQEKVNVNDAKEVFKKLGTCSQTFYHILNREFGNQRENEGAAADPFAGGLMKKGHQCGMLWGATLALGIESNKRCKQPQKATRLAIISARHMKESFYNMAETINCREITKCNMDSFIGMTKFMIKTTLIGMDNSTCFNLAERWTPKAIESANSSFSQQDIKNLKGAMSCASELVKKMGGNKEEMVAVSGFAGGLGLSGSACGALAAAIWKNSLSWAKENPHKSAWSNPYAIRTLKIFLTETGSEMLCYKICKQPFKTIDHHTDFVKNGGCMKLIETLAKAQ